ncbi:MAG TPA: EI24 domain-containing protein [Micromonosporaceae bacterium]
MATIDSRPTDRAGQFLTGVGLFVRALGMYVRQPRLMLLGAIPALISAALFVAAYALLVYFVLDLAALFTPFADDWSDGWRTLVRGIVVLALLGLGGLLVVLTFTAVTLLVGDPFYEKISEQVEEWFGGVSDECEAPWWRSLGRSLADSARLLGTTLLIAVPLLVIGLIPVVGQLTAAVLGALVGGWFLALELVGVPFSRRGLTLADRRRILKQHRPVAQGFGTAVFLCFLIPLGAVLTMPAAVIGGTLLARRVLGLPVEPPAAAPAVGPGR